MFELTNEELKTQNAALKAELTKALKTIAKLRGNQNNKAAAERIYSHYPRKVGKGNAIKAIQKALTKTTPEHLEQKVKEYAQASKGTEKQFIPHPATWFTAERWEDDPAEWASAPTQEEQPTRFGL